MKTTKKLANKIVAVICSLAMVLSLVNVNAFTAKAEESEPAVEQLEAGDVTLKRSDAIGTVKLNEEDVEGEYQYAMYLLPHDTSTDYVLWTEGNQTVKAYISEYQLEDIQNMPSDSVFPENLRDQVGWCKKAFSGYTVDNFKAYALADDVVEGLDRYLIVFWEADASDDATTIMHVVPYTEENYFYVDGVKNTNLDEDEADSSEDWHTFYANENTQIELNAWAKKETSEDEYELIEDGLTYRWYYYPKSFEESANMDYLSNDMLVGEGQTYTVKNVTEDGYYACVAYDKLGMANAFFFTVIYEKKLQVYAVGDTKRTVIGGADVTLEVNASAPAGDDSIEYQWYEYDEEEGEYESLDDETAATLDIEGIEESGVYKCVVSWGDEQVEKYFEISVTCPFTLKYGRGCYDGEIEADEDGCATMSVDVEKAENIEAIDLSYQWYIFDDDEEDWQEIPSKTERVFDVSEIESETGYKVVVTDNISGYTDELEFTVCPCEENMFWLYQDNEPEEVLTFNQSIDYEVKIANADPNETYKYQWYFESDWDEDETLLKGETSSKLHVAHVIQTGYYICKVTDSKGNCKECWNYVEVDIHLTAKAAQSSVSAKPKKPVTMKVEAEADAGITLNYEWFYDDGVSDEYVTGSSKTSTCTIPGIANIGMYGAECCVSATYNGVVIDCYWVYFDLFIYESELNVQQKGRYIAKGSPMTITATANQAITVKWYRYDEGDDEYTYLSAGTKNGNDYSYVANSIGEYMVEVISGDADIKYSFEVIDATVVTVGAAGVKTSMAAGTKCFAFTPTIGGIYEISFDDFKSEDLDDYSLGMRDTDGYVGYDRYTYDETENRIYLKTKQLDAGKTYYVTLYVDEPASYKVSVKLLEACAHKKTEVRNAVQGNCGKAGYTGDTYCKDCSALVSKGKTIEATGRHSLVTTRVEATTTAAGLITNRCSVCGYTTTQTIPMLVKNPAKVKKAKAVKKGKKIKVTWKKMSGIKGYKIQYSTAKNFKKKCKTMTVKSAKTTTKTTPKLKKGTYYVRICSYKVVSGKTYQSGWVTLKKIKIK